MYNSSMTCSIEKILSTSIPQESWKWARQKWGFQDFLPLTFYFLCCLIPHGPCHFNPKSSSASLRLTLPESNLWVAKLFKNTAPVRPHLDFLPRAKSCHSSQVLSCWEREPFPKAGWSCCPCAGVPMWMSPTHVQRGWRVRGAVALLVCLCPKADDLHWQGSVPISTVSREICLSWWRNRANPVTAL